MAAVTFNPGYYLVAWTGPATTLGTATWFPNLNYVSKPSANRQGFVSNKFGSNQSFAPFTQVTPSAQGQIISAYIFNVKTTFQLDDSLVGLAVPTAPVANSIPLASAATPATITLPANQVALTGSGTDSDGTIAGYVWRQVTGPNTATGLPSTVQSLIVSNLIAGTYQFGFKVQDDKGAFSVEQFVNVTVNPQPTGTAQDLTVTPAMGDFLTTIKGTFGTGEGLRSAFAPVIYLTDATAITVGQKSNSPDAGNFAAISRTIGTETVLTVNTLRDGTVQTLRTELTQPAGQKRVTFREGPAKKTNGSVQGTVIEYLIFHNATYATVVPPAATPTTVVMFNDSILTGYTQSIPHTKAVPRQVERLSGYTVVTDGYGGRSLTYDAVTEAQQNAIATRIAAVLNMSGVTRKILYDQTGYNDWSRFDTAPLNSQQVRALNNAVVAKIKALVPGVEYFKQTLTYGSRQGTANETFEQFVAMQSQIAADQGGTEVTGTDLMPNAPANFEDGVHFSDTGANIVAPNIVTVLQGGTTAIPAGFITLNFPTKDAGLSFANGRVSGTGRALADVKLTNGANGAVGLFLEPTSINNVIGLGVSRALTDYSALKVSAYLDNVNGTLKVRVIDNGTAKEADDSTYHNAAYAIFQNGVTFTLRYYTGLAWKTVYTYGYTTTAAMYVTLHKLVDGAINIPIGKNLTSLAAGAAGNYPVGATALVPTALSPAPRLTTFQDNIIIASDTGGSLNYCARTSTVLARGKRVSTLVTGIECSTAFIALNRLDAFNDYTTDQFLVTCQDNSNASAPMLTNYVYYNSPGGSQNTVGGTTVFAGQMHGISRSQSDVYSFDFSIDNGETWQQLVSLGTASGDFYINANLYQGRHLPYLALSSI